MVKIENVPYGVDPQINVLDLYLPQKSTYPVFVYFHGGGLENGDKDECLPFAEQLVEAGIAVASVRYRMYPEAHYPDFIEDCAIALAWVDKNVHHSGIYMGGSSAGGYLSMMLCYDGRYLDAMEVPQEHIGGYIHNAGQPTAHFNVLRERGLDTRRILVDETCPLFFVGTAKEYKPQLFIVSDHDIENRLEQTELMLSTLRHFRYDDGKIQYVKLHGDHCADVRQTDADGKNLLGKLVTNFIKTYSGNL